jgi:hypothetical protein
MSSTSYEMLSLCVVIGIFVVIKGRRSRSSSSNNNTAVRQPSLSFNPISTSLSATQGRQNSHHEGADHDDVDVDDDELDAFEEEQQSLYRITPRSAARAAGHTSSAVVLP